LGNFLLFFISEPRNVDRALYFVLSIFTHTPPHHHFGLCRFFASENGNFQIGGVRQAAQSLSLALAIYVPSPARPTSPGPLVFFLSGLMGSHATGAPSLLLPLGISDLYLFFFRKIGRLTFCGLLPFADGVSLRRRFPPGLLFFSPCLPHPPVFR